MLPWRFSSGRIRVLLFRHSVPASGPAEVVQATQSGLQKVVTLANLAAMETALFQYPLDGVGSTGKDPTTSHLQSPASAHIRAPGPRYQRDYLAQPPNNPATRGTPAAYDYNNTNYAILQGYLELGIEPQLLPIRRITRRTSQTTCSLRLLVDQNMFSPKPDSQDSAALAYSGPTDTDPGHYQQEITLVGASGWIASVRELINVHDCVAGYGASFAGHD